MALEIAIIVLIVVITILWWRYLKLKYELKQKIYQEARALFDRWKGEELEKEARERAALMFEKWRTDHEEKIRRDAIERSKQVIIGKVTEHLVPIAPFFRYNPKDVRFLGSPIDLIVFDGLEDGSVREIVFIEVKSGESGRHPSLSRREEGVRKAVEDKRVRYELLHLPSYSEARDEERL